MFIYMKGIVGFEGKTRNGWVLVERDVKYAKLVSEMIKIIENSQYGGLTCIGFYGLPLTRRATFRLIDDIKECKNDGITCSELKIVFSESASISGCYDVHVAKSI